MTEAVVNHWAEDSIFYHIYPLGLCGAPFKNDFYSPPEERLERLAPWLPHIADLGANAIYLGPLFESSSHGYDTADYYRVDRRLGTNETLKRLITAMHEKGFRIILDAVFNHVGRDFWAFQDVLRSGASSACKGWFHGLAFGKKSPYGDPFSYVGWNGHYSLVKLNLANPDVRDHLFCAMEAWIREFEIDGLRLDAADCIDIGFLRELASRGRRLKADFWLMGEIVHGDYRRWADPNILDSVTNYECYKGLYSSHVDRNYFEIAYTLNRQFGPDGLYRGIPLYSFADNHDVNRVSSMLKNPAHLEPLYIILFTMPGIPSIYYGSEWGLEGRKDGTDRQLRPELDLEAVSRTAPRPEIAGLVSRLARIRRASPALRRGDYRQLSVGHEHLAFSRMTADEYMVVVLNASNRPARLELHIPGAADGRLVDLLDSGREFSIHAGKAVIEALKPGSGAVLKLQ